MGRGRGEGACAGVCSHAGHVGQDLQPAGLQDFKVLFLENGFECPKLVRLAHPRHPQSQKLNEKIEKERKRKGEKREEKKARSGPPSLKCYKPGIKRKSFQSLKD